MREKGRGTLSFVSLVSSSSSLDGGLECESKPLKRICGWRLHPLSTNNPLHTIMYREDILSRSKWIILILNRFKKSVILSYLHFCVWKIGNGISNR